MAKPASPDRTEATTAVDPAAFARDGFAGPIRLLGAPQCASLATYLRRTSHVSHPIWAKGRGAIDGALARLAAHPLVRDLLVPLLGDDIVLWGASSIRRKAHMAHPWHVDVETGRPGRFVSLWIGLENVTPQSSLRVIAGSHRGARPLQQFRQAADLSRGEPDDEQVLGWAREDVPDARLVELAAHDGDAILFDGHLWHGSRNLLDGSERHALLLQFASSDTPVRLPKLGTVDWPFTYLDEPRPPVVPVAGRADAGINRVVALPREAPFKPLLPVAPMIRGLRTEVPDDPAKPWRPLPVFRGSTPALDLLSCHAAVLAPGHSPHPPHAHQDEELLIVLDGEAELLIADRPEHAAARPVRVKTGDFAYYPAYQHHTIRNPGDRPVRYLMFRWNRGQSKPLPATLNHFVLRDPLTADPVAGRGFSARKVAEGTTQWLRKFHCHSSIVAPGAGYAPHADAYDVAMLIESGTVRTLGREARPGDIVFYPAGSLHGLRNAGTEPARYRVFEFHGTPLDKATLPKPAARAPSLAPA